MSESILKRKSKYDLTSPAMLKVPSTMYYILERLARTKNIHWSELARDFLTDRIKKVSDE